MQDNISDDVVRELIKEKRSEKRWKNFRFFAVILMIVFSITLIFSKSRTANLPGTGGYVSLIRLDGMIEPGSGFSAEVALPLLKDAFKDSDAKGVVLLINSGGGTPVQASIIHDAIIQMKNKYHKRVVVVGEDLLASGAYYVAVAADKIYVNPNTVTGSIGVIMKGFGFPDLIKKVGIERRVYAAGANKDRLDPFLPQTKEDEEKIKTVIAEVHDNFKQVVMDGRKGKLKADPETLFSGDFWSGQTSVKLGLTDGLGNLSDVMQNEFHVETFKDYSMSESFVKSLMSQFGMSMDAVMNSDRVKMLAKL
jgi:protease-4